MKKRYAGLAAIFLLAASMFFSGAAHAQVIISQYYEGTGTNKWIELTNVGNTSINLASPQLRLGLWAVNGTTGNIKISGAATYTYNLTSTIPAKGSILIGNTGNGTEVPYLTAASAKETSNTVINFNGNDGVAILDATGKIIDRFGDGINATDVSYVRSTSVTGPSSTFVLSTWTNTSISSVQTASTTSPARLGYQLPPLCKTPTAQPTALVFSGVTNNSISGSFTASAADGFIVIRSLNSTLSANPADGTTYSTGSSLGGGTVISTGASTSFSTSGLNANTTYYFFVYAYNNTACSGGPKYLVTSPLKGSQATINPPCVSPTAQPTALNFSSVTYNSMNGSFTASSANGYVVVRSTNSTLSSNPVDGTTYTAGNALGGGTVVSSGASTSFSTSGLNANTTYYFFVFAYNNSACSGGPKYLVTNPLTGNQATPYPPCVSPAAQPTALSFSSVTFNSLNGSFTASSADGYIVVSSTSSTLSSTPVDGTVYTAGNALGGGTVLSSGASTSFTASGLNANTTYYFFVFAYNNSACTGGPKYLATAPLSGSLVTNNTPCVSPGAQPTDLTLTSITNNAMSGSFTASSADGYIVVSSTSSTLNSNPVDGTVYTAGNALGGGTVVSSGASTSFSASGLNANTTYYFFVFSYNNNACAGGPIYLATTPLTGAATTINAPCVSPVNSATAMSFSGVSSTAMTVSFAAASGVDGYLVVSSTSSSLLAGPSNGTDYVAGNSIGGGTVISSGTSTSIAQTGLSPNTTYYYYVFTYNNVSCSAGPAYNSSALTGSKTTDAAALGYYFGNLHSHSSYSDGNSDDVSKIPTDDYAYAKNALCMDFLGISEHNHATAGMHLADWQPGINQATAATSSNFVAMHGQEWGVISGGGHVIVYGMDSLMGWETGNYQIYVPKSVYVGSGGLFDIINRHGNNAFATFAHPSNSDYNNLLGTTYDLQADEAVVGTAVESGPAFSIDTTYTNPAGLGYYAYYRNMLAKGYHLGPTVDHDNHNLTFGKTTRARLAIMATSLSENNILDAMRKMRFYATEDCIAKVNFTINLQPMGSIITKAGAPAISVNTITNTAVTSIKLMYGVPGSGVAATTLTSTTTGTLSYTHTALANLATAYYFLDITEADGTRIITSPIWYTRDDAAQRAALYATSFFPVNETNEVILKWTATNEPKGVQYSIERTTDGRSFTELGTVQGKGATDGNINYAITDLSPVNGIAWYRLVQKTSNGKTSYTELRAVNRTTMATPYVSLYPNPVGDVLHIRMVNTDNGNTEISLYDMAGRKLLSKPASLTRGEQDIPVNMAGFRKGSYILKMMVGGREVSQMINKL